MIEIIEGFPENVVGILAKGEVTRQDYLDVVIPAIDKALKRNANTASFFGLRGQVMEEARSPLSSAKHRAAAGE